MRLEKSGKNDNIGEAMTYRFMKIELNQKNVFREIAMLGYMTSAILAKKFGITPSHASSYLGGMWKRNKLKREETYITKSGKKVKSYIYELNGEVKLEKAPTIKDEIVKNLKKNGEMLVSDLMKEICKSRQSVQATIKRMESEETIVRRRMDKKTYIRLLKADGIPIPPSIKRQLDTVVIDAYRKTRGLAPLQKDRHGLIEVSAFQSTFSKDSIREHVI